MKKLAAIAAVFMIININMVIAKECADQYFLSLRIKNKSKCEAHHSISTGTGVVSPSTLATIGENPVGLAYNQQLKFHGSIYQQSYQDQWHGSIVGADGNGNIGGGVSVHRFSNGNFQQSSDTLASLGLGTIVDKLKAGLGVSVRPNVNQEIASNYNEMKSKLTLGGMLNPNGTTRLGITIHDPMTLKEMAALGTSMKLGESIFFVLEGTAKDKYKKGLLKPAFGFNLSNLQFSLGANVPVNSLTKEWAQDTVTGGLAFWSGDKLKIITYYNRLELFYLGLTVVFN